MYISSFAIYVPILGVLYYNIDTTTILLLLCTNNTTYYVNALTRYSRSLYNYYCILQSRIFTVQLLL